MMALESFRRDAVRTRLRGLAQADRPLTSLDSLRAILALDRP